jgi:NAD(P)H-dependent flavin oxidoreductase YrpB (nitropropane dioxygenase family)
VLIQLSFILGPLIVAGMVFVASPEAALALSAATALGGTLGFVLADSPTAPRVRPGAPGCSGRSRRRAS